MCDHKWFVTTRMTSVDDHGVACAQVIVVRCVKCIAVGTVGHATQDDHDMFDLCPGEYEWTGGNDRIVEYVPDVSIPNYGDGPSLLH